MKKLKHILRPHIFMLGGEPIDLCATPHPCADPTCPGDINRRKLQAAEEMVRIMRDIAIAPCLFALLGENPADNFPDYDHCRCPGCNARFALSSWEKAGKGTL